MQSTIANWSRTNGNFTPRRSIQITFFVIKNSNSHAEGVASTFDLELIMDTWTDKPTGIEHDNASLRSEKKSAQSGAIVVEDEVVRDEVPNVTDRTRRTLKVNS